MKQKLQKYWITFLKILPLFSDSSKALTIKQHLVSRLHELDVYVCSLYCILTVHVKHTGCLHIYDNSMTLFWHVPIFTKNAC
jgi:hypothetical protein